MTADFDEAKVIRCGQKRKIKMMTEDTWITTYTGRRFHYLNPTVEEVDIADIAHALALSTRFRGHSRVFYSVAEHSVRVARYFNIPRLALYALLHDAAEAYLPDIPRPIKQAFGLDVLENKILEVIYKKFGLTYPVPPEIKMQVKQVDNVLLSIEAQNLLPNTDGWGQVIDTYDELPQLDPWTWQEAERIFQILFLELVEKVNEQ